MSSTILHSVMASGGRAVRYGEYTMVLMQAGTFITSPMEFVQMQNWARARMSTGNPVRDRASFMDRFDTVLARSGSGLATKGNRVALQRIIKAMTANSVPLEEWTIPHNINESVEIAKKKPVEPAVANARAAGAVDAAANETGAGGVTPLFKS